MTRPMPEWLNGRGDVAPTFESQSWEVDGVLTETRGSAFTDLEGRRMTAPIGDTESARAIRLHEMTHARISPRSKKVALSALPFASRLIECAEEFRVNSQLRKTHGDVVDLLIDGSEKLAGERVAQLGANGWGEAVAFLTAVAGTKAVNQFITGYRQHDEDGAKLLRTYNNQLKKYADENIRSSRWTDTRPVKYDDVTGRHRTPDDGEPLDECVPLGFATVTRAICELGDGLISSRVTMNEATGEMEWTDATPDEIGDAMEADGDGEEMPGDGSKPTEARNPRDVFAKILPAFPLLTRESRGSMGRRRIASNTGRAPRHISRLLTDPERRVFDRKVKGRGGILLIDISGSMSLSSEQIEEMLSYAPSATVLAYSDACRGVVPSKPNLWILAKGGRMVAESTLNEIGNGGNGCDGTAIQYAQKMRKSGEPFIWVCDGYVTSCNGDSGSARLSLDCLALVRRFGIHSVETPDEAIEALKRAGRGGTLPRRASEYLERCAGATM